MDSNLRVSGTESHTDLPKDFTCVSKIWPPERSFYTSLGISLIQSLIRIKGTSYFNIYWKGLQDHIQEIQRHARAYNSQALFNIYATLINVLTDQDRYTAIYWLTYYLSTNQDNAIGAIEVGTKCLMCACLNFKTYEFPIIWSSQPYDFVTKKFYLENLANYLRVHILLVNDRKFEIFCRSDKKTAPLITLYLEKYYDYGILYHSEAYALDNSQENLDTNRYPFLYDPKIDHSRLEEEPLIRSKISCPLNPIPEEKSERDDIPIIEPKEKINPIITDFFKEITITLAKTAKIPNKNNLLNITEKLIDNLPEDESILILHKTISNIPDCRHEISWYSPNCTQEHCLKCLYETIQSSHNKSAEIKCPCNKKMSLKCIDEIEKKCGEKPAPKKNNIKKAPNESENKGLYSYETQLKNFEPKKSFNLIQDKEVPADRIRSASQGLRPKEKLQRSNIDFEAPQNSFNIKPPSPSPKNFNIKRADSVIINSGYPEPRNPEPRNPEPRNPEPCSPEPEKTFSIKLKEPIKVNFKDCENCKEQKEEDEFNTVVCNGHDICSYCRAKSKKTGECPICKRKYSDYEMSYITALVSSFQEKEMPC